MAKFKTITSIGAFGVIALIAFLFWQISGLKSEKAGLEGKLITVEAEKDSIKGLGEYSIPDTVWGDSILVPFSVPYVVHDTLPPDSIWLPFPRLRGKVSFDITEIFGEDSSLSIQVRGKFFWPEQLPDTNFVQIIPDWRKPPVTPLTARSPKRWGIGLGYVVSSSGANSIGGFGRFNKTSIALYRQFDQNVWILGLNYEIF